MKRYLFCAAVTFSALLTGSSLTEAKHPHRNHRGNSVPHGHQLNQIAPTPPRGLNQRASNPFCHRNPSWSISFTQHGVQFQIGPIQGTYHNSPNQYGRTRFNPPVPPMHRPGNHYPYVPGHYDFHRTGHWDF